MRRHAVHTRVLSKRRIRLFKWISILLPFVLLFMLEMGLRVFHYGYNLRLFIEYAANRDYLVLNPAASKKYFTNQANATAGNSEPFKKEKDPGTMRIFVLGESTTIGYPYFHNGSFHRWMQYRLMHDYPDRNFEVINISLTAVNSYTVLGFSREVVDYQPDAILIYTGHNEYYGALGVGSTDCLGGSRRIVDLLLSLRQLRLVQWMTNTYERLAGALHGHRTNSPVTRMEAMVADEQIPYGSKLYQRGVDQFRENMEETLQLLDRRHIPVFISNLIANEKDLVPFISIEADSTRYPAFKKSFAQAKAAFDAADWPTAYRYFREAEGIDSMYAQCNFYLGCLSLKQGDPGQAKAWFSRAEELDALRFRAPSPINHIIPRLAAQYRGIHLVDTRSAFEARSEYGIIGNELLLEHVHPNIRGYALLSDAFYRAMKAAGILGVTSPVADTLYSSAAPAASTVSGMTLDYLLHSMPVLEMDSLAGAYKIGKLKNSWPFNRAMASTARSADSASSALSSSSSPLAPPRVAAGFALSPSASLQARLAYGIVFEKIDWEDAMDTLYNYYAGLKDWPRAVKVVEGLALEHSTNPEFYDRVANIYGEMKEDADAAFWFRRSFVLAPDFEKARKIFVLYLKMDRPAEALPFLDYAIRNNASGANLVSIRQIAQDITRLQQAAPKDKPDLAILNNIAARYMAMGLREGAVHYADSVIKIDPGNKGALSILKR